MAQCAAYTRACACCIFHNVCQTVLQMVLLRLDSLQLLHGELADSLDTAWLETFLRLLSNNQVYDYAMLAL